MLGCAVREFIRSYFHRVTAPTNSSELNPERLPLGIRIFYGIGSISEGTKNFTFNVFLLFFYNNVLGLSGSLAGLAIFIALCVDAVTDPLVGSISDSFRSRWGRRHPFMYASALPMAVCFVLLFSPPELSETGLFVWLCCFAVGVRASMTFYSIPSSAMLPEMTSNYDERTSLVSWRYLLGWLGGIGMTFIAYRYFLVPTPAYPDGRLNPEAYSSYATLGAVVIFGAIMVCALGTHRLIATMRKSSGATDPFSVRRLLGELKETFGNRSYLMVVLALMSASVAGGFNDVVGLYVNTYFWEFTTDQLSLLLLTPILSIVVAFGGTRKLTERFDKREAALGLTTFAVFVGPLPIFLRLAGWMPPNGDPLLFSLILVHTGLVVAPVVAIGIIASSMVADTVDQTELATGHRREGMFSSAIAFSLKAASGVGTLAAGIALDWIAFPRGAEVGAIAQGKLVALGLAVGPGLLFFYFLTLFFLSRYRMTRTEHRAILDALALRRPPTADL